MLRWQVKVQEGCWFSAVTLNGLWIHGVVQLLGDTASEDAPGMFVEKLEKLKDIGRLFPFLGKEISIKDVGRLSIGHQRLQPVLQEDLSIFLAESIHNLMPASYD